jgi:hypothetical protein
MFQLLNFGPSIALANPLTGTGMSKKYIFKEKYITTVAESKLSDFSAVVKSWWSGIFPDCPIMYKKTVTKEIDRESSRTRNINANSAESFIASLLKSPFSTKITSHVSNGSINTVSMPSRNTEGPAKHKVQAIPKGRAETSGTTDRRA